ncbi:MAG: hypothetical protein KAT66_02060 [Candidatus Lokiarchaeota archaeon]|nr:hypothetical protein [Candidatus Lokiarchaeota archaeon]
MSKINHDVIRIFDLDYLIFDFIFLLIFLTVLIINKKKIPIYVGFVCGILFLVIDGIIWWNTGIREIDPSNTKIYVDFMMDFSYGLLAFSWVMIMFERNSIKEILLWTLFLYGGWLLIASLSQILPLIDLEIITIRHMQSLRVVEIATVVCGYLLLIFLRYNYKTILFIFWVGFMLSFMMESYLLFTQIRPSGFELLLYDSFILTNQGIPYLFVIFDKILPKLRDFLRKSKEEIIEVSFIE